MAPSVRSRALQGFLASALALGSAFSESAESEAPDFADLDGSDALSDADAPVDARSTGARRASSGGEEGDSLRDELQQPGDQSDAASARASLFAGFSRDPQGVLRAKLAEATGRLWRDAPAQALDILSELAEDPVPAVRRAVARGLAHFMERAPASLRAATESDWTRAPSRRQREVVALALGIADPDWLTDLALGELAGDPSGAVRRAALSGARAQLSHDPAAYGRIALGHIDDPDRRVRSAARRLVGAAQRLGWAELTRDPQAQREHRQRFRRALHDSAVRSV
jgi:hypothetical protein